MNRETVITALRAHESEQRAAGVVRLSLFGSTTRGEARPDSDIYLLAALDDARPLALFDVIRIENQLSDLLGHAVDLIEEGTLKPRIRHSVDREATIIRSFPAEAARRNDRLPAAARPYSACGGAGHRSAVE